MVYDADMVAVRDKAIRHDAGLKEMRCDRLQKGYPRIRFQTVAKKRHKPV